MDALYPQTLSLATAALAVLLPPGLAWAAWAPSLPWARPTRRDPLAWLADAVALSISLTALLGLLLYLARPLTPAGVSTNGGWVFLAAGVACAAAALWGGLELLPRLGKPRLADIAWLLGGLAALAGLIGWRLFQAHGLALAPWVDSVHHTLIVRVIQEQGGVPETLLPYENASFFYYYGFHLMAALFAGWSGLEPPAATLWLGQVINGLVALSVARLAFAAGQNRPRVFVAAVLVGLALHMPAYYLTWGRFTLLTGLVTLPAAMAAVLDVRAEPASWEARLRLAVLTAGTALCHYLALILLGAFTGLVLLFALWQDRRNAGAWVQRFAGAIQAGGFALAGVLLASPWLWHAWGFVAWQARLTVVTSAESGAPHTSPEYWNYLGTLTGPLRNHILLGVAAGGLLLALLLRRNLRPLAVWGAALGLLTLPLSLRIYPFRPDHFAILLFLPAAVFIAELAGSLGDALNHFSRRGWPAALLALAVGGGLGAWGVRETVNIINPTTVFVDSQDVAALDWIRANTPPDARFYNNAVLWQGNLWRGVDGGYWLEPYAQRGSLTPPMVYAWAKPEAIEQVNDWAERASKVTGCTPDFWALVREANLTHVYTHAGKGSLRASALQTCPRLRQIYGEGNVALFEIIPLQ